MLFTSTLRGKFLAFHIPLLLLTFALIVGGFEWVTYDRAYDRLRDRLVSISASQSIILAAPVAHRETERISLIIASAIADPDLEYISVFDTDGSPLDTFGDIRNADPSLWKRTTITYVEEATVEVVGRLELALTDRRLLVEMRERLIFELAAGLALLLAAVISANLAHRRTVEMPLVRLSTAIQEARGGEPRETVEWRTADEMGRLIEAYNDMQQRLHGHERELRELHENLERLVRERTAALDHALQDAEAANRAKSDFLSIVSHELRTPLTSIRGSLGLIAGGTTGDLAGKTKEMVDIAARNSERLVALVDQILDLNKIISADVQIKASPVGLAELARRTISATKPYADKYDVEIQIAESDNDVFVIGDDQWLEQVLSNLISNAVKFSPRGDTVDVSVRRHNRSVRVSVKDNGPGIPEQFRDKVFDRFTQSDTSDGRHRGGTGLGLNIAKAIIDKHGGLISFDTREGGGTTFFFELPEHSEKRVRSA